MKVELLAPAGKLENALAAIENGADALFVGGKQFNARQYAENFTDEAFKEMIDYAKLRGVNSYVTVNTLIKECELQNLFKYLEQLSKWEVAGIISQDMTVLQMVKKYFPQLVLHASTQMTAHNVSDVKRLDEMGFSRVVLSRELLLEEIENIHQSCNIELETFIHGALCYSYSGQCLMSSFIGGRSGNRGRCAQPCRMEYQLLSGKQKCKDTAYLLSLKDMCTLEDLPILINSGITSFKIEGRMKSPEYVASVVRIYRKYIDKYLAGGTYEVAQEDKEELLSVFNRGGFSKGYYFQKSGQDMVSLQSPRNRGLKIGKVISYHAKTKIATILPTKTLVPGDGIEITRENTTSIGSNINRTYEKDKPFGLLVDKIVTKGDEVYLTKNHFLLKELQKTYQKNNRKTKIHLEIIGEYEKPVILKVQTQNDKIILTGECITYASQTPVTKQQAQKQLSKWGNTPFEVENVRIQWPENAYIPLTKLNNLRREAATQLEEAICNKYTHDIVQSYEVEECKHLNQQSKWIAQVKTIEQLLPCIQEKQIEGIYWEWEYDEDTTKRAWDECKKHQKLFYLVLPSVMRKEEEILCKKAIEKWNGLQIQGFVIRTYGQWYLLKDIQTEKIIDTTLQVWNQEAITYWQKEGATRITVAAEVEKQEMLQLKGPLEKIVYGYIPVMVSAQCVLGNNKQCKKYTKKQSFFLQDRKDVKWPIVTNCNSCTMKVLTPLPIGTSRQEEIEKLPIITKRLVFTIETKEQVQTIINGYLENSWDVKPKMSSLFLKSVQ